MATVYRRGKAWWIRFQWNGQEIRKSARTTVKSEAREYLEQVKAQYRELTLTGRQRVTFDAAAVMYITEDLPSKEVSTVASYLQSLRVLTAEFSGKWLDEIDRKAIAAFEAKQAKRVSASKRRHYRAALSGVFKTAYRHDLVERNPCRDLEPIKIANERYRYLRPAEWSLLWHALPEPHKSIAELSVLRGLRCGEILGLNWEDVDFVRDEISLFKTKNHMPRVVPLEGGAAVFNRLGPKDTGIIFASSRGVRMSVLEVTRKINRIAREVKIADFTFHDLRHTYGSWYMQNGGNLYTLQRILGHKGPTMTQRYAHLEIEHLRDRAQKPAQPTKDFLH